MSHNAFYQLMQQVGLANRPTWTIAGRDKIPRDPQSGLKTHFDPQLFKPEKAYRDPDHFWGAAATDPKHSLVTLTELVNEPNLANVPAFALYANVLEQGVILIDLEKDYDHRLDPLLKQVPALYGETSHHGGTHLLIDVPPYILHDPKYQALFQVTSKKIGTTKQPHSGIEFFFNNHYLTFTEQQIPTNPNKSPNGIIKLLDWVLDHTNIANAGDPNLTTSQTAASIGALMNQAPADAKRLYQHVLSNPQIDDLKTRSKQLNDPNYHGPNNPQRDWDQSQSHRDYLVFFYIAKAVLNSMSHDYLGAATPLSSHEKAQLNNPRAGFDPQILSWVILLIGLDPSLHLVKVRDKLVKHRINQQVYAQYTVNEALTYLLNHDDNRVYRSLLVQTPKEAPKNVKQDA